MELKEEAKAAAEVSLELFVEKAYEPAAEELLKKIKDLIPGEAYDGIVDLIAAPMKPILKKALLDQIEKISDKV